MASKFVKNLPLTICAFLNTIDATESYSSSVLSYLLFERDFCNALIELRYHDGMERKDEIRDFITEPKNGRWSSSDRF